MRTAIILLVTLLLAAGCQMGSVRDYSADYPTDKQNEYVERMEKLGEPLKVEIDFSGIMEFPVKRGNAVQHYKKAFDIYDKKKDSEGFIPAGSEAVSELIAGTGFQKSKLAPDFFKPATTPEHVIDASAAYILASAVLGRVTEHENSGDLVQAEELLKRIVVFGTHLARDHESFNQVMTGVVIQLMGAEQLAEFYEKHDMNDKLPAVKTVLEELAKKRDMLKTKLHLLDNVRRFAALKMCLQTVESDPVPLWRKEAATTLAVLRICGFKGHQEKGDRYVMTIRLLNPEMQNLAAEGLKKVIEKDEDPAVRLWAKWCSDNITATTLDNIENLVE